MVYLWTVINPNDTDRVTTVLDLKGVTLATATKADTVLFVKQCVTMMSTHYPEVRVLCVCVCVRLVVVCRLSHVACFRRVQLERFSFLGEGLWAWGC